MRYKWYVNPVGHPNEEPTSYYVGIEPEDNPPDDTENIITWTTAKTVAEAKAICLRQLDEVIKDLETFRQENQIADQPQTPDATEGASTADYNPDQDR